MAQIHPGRFTANIDGPFVVFLIGMRINRIWQIWKWLPVAWAMPRMLAKLFKNRELGLLHVETFLGWRTTLSLQYWQSFEQLEHFARNPDDPHLEPWRRFNKSVGSNGSVGIYHETYLVGAGKWEAVYGNMPAFGLAAATQRIAATGRKETARRRLGGDSEPAVTSPAVPDSG